MSGKFVRASKYRHVFGQASKKELCYENLKITKNAWDSNIIQTNGKYISVNWDISGGGAFAIIPVKEVGKAPDTVSLFRGHKGPVLDTSFNPFNDQEIVSSSDDGNIYLWEIPEDYSFHNYLDENSQIKDIVEPKKILSGHSRKVGHVEFHPCAENVLASSSLDYSVKLWNIETGKDVITLKHTDLVTSFAFNYNGSLLATTSRDKKLRVWDIREGKVISEGPSHTGAKPSRVTWVGNTDRIITTGFSKMSDRQIGLWDVNSIESGPIDGFIYIDSSAGVLIPVFDESNSILYLAGKGDGNIRYYEYDKDVLYDISQYSSVDAQRGFATAPKRAVNVRDNEILKAYKTVNDNLIEPISFIVPRRSELFQSDIYPDCPSTQPSLSASEFFDGKESNGPKLMSMEALYNGGTPFIRDADAVTNISSVKNSTPEIEKKQIPEAQADTKKSVPDVKESVIQDKINISKDSMPEDSKNVDELLKKSSSVDEMISKVSDESDEEKEGSKDEDWEEIKRPDSLEKPGEASSSAVSSTMSDSSMKPLEAEDEGSVLPMASKASSKPTMDNSYSEPLSKEQGPTLRGTVEKLASLVDKLGEEVKSLGAIITEKDDRLAILESKIEALLESK